MEEENQFNESNRIDLPAEVEINVPIGFNLLSIGMNGVCWLSEIQKEEIRAEMSDEEVL